MSKDKKDTIPRLRDGMKSPLLHHLFLLTAIIFSDPTFKLLSILHLKMDSRKSQAAYPDIASRLTCAACLPGSTTHSNCPYHRHQGHIPLSQPRGGRSGDARSLQGDFPSFTLGRSPELTNCVGSSVHVELGSRASPTANWYAGRDVTGHNEVQYKYVERSTGQHEKPHMDFEYRSRDLLCVGSLFD